VSFFMPSIVL